MRSLFINSGHISSLSIRHSSLTNDSGNAQTSGKEDEKWQHSSDESVHQEKTSLVGQCADATGHPSSGVLNLLHGNVLRGQAGVQRTEEEGADDHTVADLLRSQLHWQRFSEDDVPKWLVEKKCTKFT